MADIVNLNRLRKARARAGKEDQAAENRARFGVPKKERNLTKARSELAKRGHGALKLDSDKPLEK